MVVLSKLQISKVKVSAGFEFWINDATSDFYIQGTTDHRAELATGKDVN